MARMIDADALQELCNERIQDTWNSGVAPVSWAAAYADFKDDIDSMPTLTQPGTVYCQDCIHHEDGYTHWCNKWEHVCPDDSEFFCKFGRKKDGSKD